MTLHQLAVPQGGYLVLQVFRSNIEYRDYLVGSGFATVFNISINYLLQGVQSLGSDKSCGLTRAGGGIYCPGVTGLSRRSYIQVTILTESLTQISIALAFGNIALALLTFQFSCPVLLWVWLVQNKAPRFRSLDVLSSRIWWPGILLL